jgi:hypothetical protein
MDKLCRAALDCGPKAEPQVFRASRSLASGLVHGAVHVTWTECPRYTAAAQHGNGPRSRRPLTSAGGRSSAADPHGLPATRLARCKWSRAQERDPARVPRAFGFALSAGLGGPRPTTDPWIAWTFPLKRKSWRLQAPPRDGVNGSQPVYPQLIVHQQSARWMRGPPADASGARHDRTPVKQRNR